MKFHENTVRSPEESTSTTKDKVSLWCNVSRAGPLYVCSIMRSAGILAQNGAQLACCAGPLETKPVSNPYLCTGNWKWKIMLYGCESRCFTYFNLFFYIVRFYVWHDNRSVTGITAYLIHVKHAHSGHLMKVYCLQKVGNKVYFESKRTVGMHRDSNSRNLQRSAFRAPSHSENKKVGSVSWKTAMPRILSTVADTIIIWL